MQITDLNYVIYLMAYFTNSRLSFTEAVYLTSIIFARTFFTLVAQHFEIIFKSKFNNETSLKFLIYYLFLLRFSRSLWCDCRCEAQICFSYFDSFNKCVFNAIPNDTVKLFCEPIITRWLTKWFFRIKWRNG